MTRRRLFRSDIGRVAVTARIRLLKLGKLFFNRNQLRVGRFLIVLVTSGAGSDGHIRRQPSQGRGTRNVDVTGSTFQDVFALTAFMTELCRNAFRCQHGHECARRFVTTGAIVVNRLLIFPVTAETRIVTAGHCFEELAGLIGRVRDRR